MQEIHLHFHSSNEEKLDRIISLLQTNILNQKKEMATIDQLVQDVQDETSVENSLVTLTQTLKADLDAALAGTSLPADVQAKIDAAFAQIETNKATLAAAITANTPAAQSAK